jgi:hypothetical protein
MVKCTYCGETFPAEAATCPVCGLSLAEPGKAERKEKTKAGAAAKAATVAEVRTCPSCGKSYTEDYADTFCTCGVELVSAVLPRVPPGEQAPPAPASAAERPPTGTRCLVLLRPDKQPLRWFPLSKDATLIGRQDPVSGTFPDIDLAEWLDVAAVRKVSRKHALVLHSRASDAFFFRPLAGNTGTQIDADMVLPLRDYPLAPGRRIILGGAVRLRFEIA